MCFRVSVHQNVMKTCAIFYPLIFGSLFSNRIATVVWRAHATNLAHFPPQHAPWFLGRQSSASACYVIEQFVGAIAQRSAFCALLDARGAARCEEQGKGNLRWSETEQQRGFPSTTCITIACRLLWASITVYRWNFADMIHWQHRHFGQYVNIEHADESVEVYVSKIMTWPEALHKLIHSHVCEVAESDVGEVAAITCIQT